VKLSKSMINRTICKYSKQPDKCRTCKAMIISTPGRLLQIPLVSLNYSGLYYDTNSDNDGRETANSNNNGREIAEGRDAISWQ
jgi:hypothetical protein